MARFQARPRFVEAFCWTGGLDQAEDPVWVAKAMGVGVVEIGTPGENVRMRIATARGVQTAKLGDWIVRSEDGTVTAYTPDEFAARFLEGVEPG